MKNISVDDFRLGDDPELLARMTVRYGDLSLYNAALLKRPHGVAFVPPKRESGVQVVGMSPALYNAMSRAVFDRYEAETGIALQGRHHPHGAAR